MQKINDIEEQELIMSKINDIRHKELKRRKEIYNSLFLGDCALNLLSENLEKNKGEEKDSSIDLICKIFKNISNIPIEEKCNIFDDISGNKFRKTLKEVFITSCVELISYKTGILTDYSEEIVDSYNKRCPHCNFMFIYGDVCRKYDMENITILYHAKCFLSNFKESEK